MRTASALLALPLLLLACGARSSLSIGAGGHASTADTGGSSASSSSGEVPCSMQVLAPILTVDDPKGGDAVQPSLITQYTEPPTAALVYASRPAGLPTATRVMPFDGWGAWPPALPAPTPLIVEGIFHPGFGVLGISVLAAAHHGMVPSSFAMLFGADDGKGGVNMNFSMSAIAMDAQEVGGDTPLALASSMTTNTYLSLTRGQDGPYSKLDAFRNTIYDHSFGGGEDGPIGCASTPVSADATPVIPDATGFVDGFILGAALGTVARWREFVPHCADISPTIDPATHLSFMRVPWPESGPSPILTYEAQSVVTRLRMAPRNLGAWAAWTTEGSPDYVWSARLSDKPVFLEKEPVGIGIGDENGNTGQLKAGTFAVARLGDDSLVIGMPGTLNGKEVILVAARPDTPADTSTWSVHLSPEGVVDSPIAMVPSPTGRAVLVAWSELPEGETDHRIRIARLECAP